MPNMFRLAGNLNGVVEMEEILFLGEYYELKDLCRKGSHYKNWTGHWLWEEKQGEVPV